MFFELLDALSKVGDTAECGGWQGERFGVVLDGGVKLMIAGREFGVIPCGSGECDGEGDSGLGEVFSGGVGNME